MPAKSKAQRRLFAIAEHKPQMLFKKNQRVLSMDKKEMHKMASTSEKGLPEKKKRSSKKKKKMLK